MFHGNGMQIKEPKVHLLSDIPCDQTTGNFVLKLVTAYSTWVAHTSNRKCLLLQKVKKSMAWLPYDKLLTTPARYQARGVRLRGGFCGNLPALGQHCRDLGPTLPSDGKRYDRYSEPFFSFTIQRWLISHFSTQFPRNENLVNNCYVASCFRQTNWYTCQFWKQEFSSFP